MTSSERIIVPEMNTREKKKFAG